MSEVWGLRTLLDDTIEPGSIRLMPLSIETLQEAVDAVWELRARRPLPLPPMRPDFFESITTSISATDGRNGGENMPETTRVAVICEGDGRAPGAR